MASTNGEVPRKTEDHKPLTDDMIIDHHFTKFLEGWAFVGEDDDDPPNPLSVFMQTPVLPQPISLKRTIRRKCGMWMAGINNFLNRGNGTTRAFRV
jgi:hypothetical protein